MTFMDNAITQGLPQPLFTADLKRSATGSYDFGFIDDSKYTGDITYVPVVPDQGFWEFNVTGYTVGSGTTTIADYDSIADTGSSLMYMPTDVVGAYYGQIQGAMIDNAAGGWVLPCDITPPDLTLAIAGYNAFIPGSYMMYAPVTDASRSSF